MNNYSLKRAEGNYLGLVAGFGFQVAGFRLKITSYWGADLFVFPVTGDIKKLATGHG